MSKPNQITILGVASFSSPTMIPITTSSPARNGTVKPASTISVRGITRTGWEDLLHRTGLRRRQPFHTLNLLIHSRSIYTATCEMCLRFALIRTDIRQAQQGEPEYYALIA